MALTSSLRLHAASRDPMRDLSGSRNVISNANSVRLDRILPQDGRPDRGREGLCLADGLFLRSCLVTSLVEP
jgi:hypothetical protein